MWGSDYESRKNYEKEGDFKGVRRKEKKDDNEIRKQTVGKKRPAKAWQGWCGW